MPLKILYIFLILVIGIVLFVSCFLDSGKENMISTNQDVITTKNHEKLSAEEIRLVQDYQPIPLPRLIAMSELVVLGSITEVLDSQYRLQVFEVLKGEDQRNTIIVNQFIPSKFDGPRSVPYARDQQFLLFLFNPNKDGLVWTILGNGEGEMPVEEGFVYFEGSFIEGLEKKAIEVQGKNRNLQRFDYSYLKDAVTHYGSCFNWQITEEVKNDKKRQRWLPSNRCDEQMTKEYKSRSWIHWYLVQETTRYIQ